MSALPHRSIARVVARRAVGVLVALLVAFGSIAPAVACRAAKPCCCKPASTDAVCAPDCCVTQAPTDTALKPTPVPGLVIALLSRDVARDVVPAPAPIPTPKRSARVCLHERARPRLPLRI